MAKDAVYFSHDSNARRDPKILSLRSLWGAEGYGWWWMVVEMLREQNSYRLSLDRHCVGALAFEFGGVTAEKAEQFLTDCIDIGLLEKDENEKIFAPSLVRRMTILENKRQKRVEAANARWGNKDASEQKKDANEMQKQEKDNAKHKQSPEKSSKDKIRQDKTRQDKTRQDKTRQDNSITNTHEEQKKEKYFDAEFVTLTEAEFQKLINEHGEVAVRRMVVILDNYKGANGKKYKSDYRAILNWVVDRYKEESTKGNLQGSFNKEKNTPVPLGFSSIVEA